MRSEQRVGGRGRHHLVSRARREAAETYAVPGAVGVEIAPAGVAGVAGGRQVALVQVLEVYIVSAVFKPGEVVVHGEKKLVISAFRHGTGLSDEDLDLVLVAERVVAVKFGANRTHQ